MKASLGQAINNTATIIYNPTILHNNIETGIIILLIEQNITVRIDPQIIYCMSHGATRYRKLIANLCKSKAT